MLTFKRYRIQAAADNPHYNRDLLGGLSSSEIYASDSALIKVVGSGMNPCLLCGRVKNLTDAALIRKYCNISIRS